MNWLSVDIVSLNAAYKSGRITPSHIVREFSELVVPSEYAPVWISKFSETALMARAKETEQAAKAPGIAAMPLYGVQVAVKDNIDVKGLPTTAACPAFAYTPERSAMAVQLLEHAGAIIVGKTNLDQFATGLVGVRSPYGEAPNAFDARYISGGSSSGSAVAVAMGQVHLALGTDTAGSGRVPAALNNLVGLKPTRGIISTGGVVPACRTLDCVSILARTLADAALALSVTTSRDDDARQTFASALEALKSLGATIDEIDFAPFTAAARLLYEGPFVAERLEAAGDLLRDQPESTDPVVAGVIRKGHAYTALDAFNARRDIALLKQRVGKTLSAYDALAAPSIPGIYTRAELNADPITLNSRLGTYTNAVNLLDLCALAIPTGFRSDRMPAGITLIKLLAPLSPLAGEGELKA